MQVPSILHTASCSVLNQLVAEPLQYYLPESVSQVAVPQTWWWLKTTAVYPLSVLEAKFEIKVLAGAMLPSKPLWQNPSWPLPFLMALCVTAAPSLCGASSVFMWPSSLWVCLPMPSLLFCFYTVARVILVALQGSNLHPCSESSWSL